MYSNTQYLADTKPNKIPFALYLVRMSDSQLQHIPNILKSFVLDITHFPKIVSFDSLEICNPYTEKSLPFSGKRNSLELGFFPRFPGNFDSDSRDIFPYFSGFFSPKSSNSAQHSGAGIRQFPQTSSNAKVRRSLGKKYLKILQASWSNL